MSSILTNTNQTRKVLQIPGIYLVEKTLINQLLTQIRDQRCQEASKYSIDNLMFKWDVINLALLFDFHIF